MRRIDLVVYEPSEPEADKDPEPRVVTEDVAAVLRNVVRPGDEDVGKSVSLIAERADTSTRTVYRVLAQSTASISLDLADRLCGAADVHLSRCRIMWPGTKPLPYNVTHRPGQ